MTTIMFVIILYKQHHEQHNIIWNRVKESVKDRI